MKKVMFIQSEGNVLGGIWSVHETLALQFVQMGYDVSIVSVRNALNGEKNKIDSRVKIITINDKLSWEILHKRDVIRPIKGLHIIDFFKNLKQYFKDQKELFNDFKKMKEYIRQEVPNYIIVSHYQTLEAIPNEYLKRTINVQHSSFKNVYMFPACLNAIKKYSTKVYCTNWLSKATADEAKRIGIANSRYQYNPIRFNTDKIADVCKNRCIVVGTRFSEEKRIDLMIDIVNELFKDSRFKYWTFEIYGSGDLDEKTLEIITSNPQMNLHGVYTDASDFLLCGSINLNTSKFEGFSISILEACVCGVPTVSFDFGESVYEEIIDGETGLIVLNDNRAEYIEKLKTLMSDMVLLKKMSGNARDFSQKFDMKKIADEWVQLFNEMDEQ